MVMFLPNMPCAPLLTLFGLTVMRHFLETTKLVSKNLARMQHDERERNPWKVDNIIPRKHLQHLFGRYAQCLPHNRIHHLKTSTKILSCGMQLISGVAYSFLRHALTSYSCKKKRRSTYVSHIMPLQLF